MKKIYYEKIGRRYVPVSEYDSEYLDSFSRGTHIVMCYPGGQSRRYNIDPNYAAMIAAGRLAEDGICEAMRKASEMRPQRTPLTPGQKKAWEKLAKEFASSCKNCSDECDHNLQAEEYFNFNIIGAYVGVNTPVYIVVGKYKRS